MNVTLIF